MVNSVSNSCMCPVGRGRVRCLDVCCRYVRDLIPISAAILAATFVCSIAQCMISIFVKLKISNRYVIPCPTNFLEIKYFVVKGYLAFL